MANQEHYEILRQGVMTWNQWRKKLIEIRPNLTRAKLGGADLSVATLIRANLSGANLNHAELTGTKLQAANLSGATLNYADLEGVDLTRADLTRADLTGARLETSVLVETDLSGATLTQCSVYGISVWNVQLEGAKQESLVITPTNESTVTVDNLKVAQFIYLLLNNREIRDVIDTIGQRGVLILGRFSNERKQVLDALREKLRELNYLRKYNWVLDTLEYDTSDNLINALEKAIVEPALIKHKELMAKKVEQLSTRHIKDYS